MYQGTTNNCVCLQINTVFGLFAMFIVYIHLNLFPLSVWTLHLIPSVHRTGLNKYVYFCTYCVHFDFLNYLQFQIYCSFGDGNNAD